MGTNSTVNDVVHLPRNFRDRGNVSMYALLREIGYFAVHEQVTEDAIHRALLEYPECVHDWMDWSEGKRTDAGWFFRREGETGYEVGYFPVCSDRHQVIKYPDEAAACAAFIKREIEDIRTDSKG